MAAKAGEEGGRGRTRVRQYKYILTPFPPLSHPLQATGEIIGAFGLTEPDHGSDPAGMLTNAKWDESKREWVLNGAKMWITNAPVCDVAVVWGKAHGNGETGAVRGFIIPRSSKGFSTPRIEGKFSLRASATGQLVMEDVRLPMSSMLPNSKGMSGPFSCLNSARFGIAWGALGAAEACFDTARRYVAERKQFGAPLAANQIIQLRLANMLVDIAAAKAMVLQVGRLREAALAAAVKGGPDDVAPELISIVKRASCAAALRTARDARDMLGGNGISDEYDVIRHVLNLESVNTYEGTETIHALTVGRGITGIPSFTPAQGVGK
jgi:glutaryl-CoA dehydrogenase